MVRATVPAFHTSFRKTSSNYHSKYAKESYRNSLKENNFVYTSRHCPSAVRK